MTSPTHMAPGTESVIIPGGVMLPGDLADRLVNLTDWLGTHAKSRVGQYRTVALGNADARWRSHLVP